MFIYCTRRILLFNLKRFSFKSEFPTLCRHHIEQNEFQNIRELAKIGLPGFVTLLFKFRGTKISYVSSIRTYIKRDLRGGRQDYSFANKNVQNTVSFYSVAHWDQGSRVGIDHVELSFTSHAITSLCMA